MEQVKANNLIKRPMGIFSRVISRPPPRLCSPPLRASYIYIYNKLLRYHPIRKEARWPFKAYSIQVMDILNSDQQNASPDIVLGVGGGRGGGGGGGGGGFEVYDVTLEVANFPNMPSKFHGSFL